MLDFFAYSVGKNLTGLYKQCSESNIVDGMRMRSLALVGTRDTALCAIVQTAQKLSGARTIRVGDRESYSPHYYSCSMSAIVLVRPARARAHSLLNVGVAYRNYGNL